MASLERIELSSIVLETIVLPLNYKLIGAGTGNRTLNSSLENYSFTFKLFLPGGKRRIRTFEG